MHKKRRSLFLHAAVWVTMVSVLFGVSLVSYATNGTPYSRVVSTLLKGSEEVPPTNTGRTAHANFMIRSDEQSIDYILTIPGNDITAAHLHCAPVGQNGPAIVTLFDTAGAYGSTTTNWYNATTTWENGMRQVRGTIDMGDIMPAGMNCNPNIQTMAHLVQAMRERMIYVNEHSTSYPNGELRGQVMMTTHMPDNGYYHATGTAVYDSDQLRITEISTSTGQGNPGAMRTFVVTISNRLLEAIVRFFNAIRSAVYR